MKGYDTIKTTENKIGDKGAGAMSEALMANKTLHALYMTGEFKTSLKRGDLFFTCWFDQKTFSLPLPRMQSVQHGAPEVESWNSNVENGAISSCFFLSTSTIFIVSSSHDNQQRHLSHKLNFVFSCERLIATFFFSRY